MTASNTKLHKAGVFPYLGSEIGASNPDKVYRVYRPIEELEKALDSMKLVPLIWEHKFINDGEVEDVKMRGIIGENVHIDGVYLVGDVKIHSSFLQRMVEQGRNQLSPGYRATYEFKSGYHAGERYDVIQRNIQYNHVAQLGGDGRSGSEVAIDSGANVADLITLDSSIFNFSNKEEVMADENNINQKDGEVNNNTDENEVAFSPEQLEMLRELISNILNESQDEDKAEDEEKEEEVKDEEEEKQEDESLVEELKEEIEELKATQDSLRSRIIKDINERDNLAKQLAPVIGTFDSSMMSNADDVAQYAVKKLNIMCDSKEALPVIKGYIAGSNVKATQDSAPVKKGNVSHLWS